MVYYIVSGLFLMFHLFFWCPCMAINVNVYSISVGFSPTLYCVDPMLSASGNLFKCHEEVLYLQPLIPPKRYDIFPPITGGCSEGLGGCVLIFLEITVLLTICWTFISTFELVAL